jgi:hypothetical protein
VCAVADRAVLPHHARALTAFPKGEPDATSDRQTESRYFRTPTVSREEIITPGQLGHQEQAAYRQPVDAAKKREPN